MPFLIRNENPEYWQQKLWYVTKHEIMTAQCGLSSYRWRVKLNAANYCWTENKDKESGALSSIVKVHAFYIMANSWLSFSSCHPLTREHRNKFARFTRYLFYVAISNCCNGCVFYFQLLDINVSTFDLTKILQPSHKNFFIMVSKSGLPLASRKQNPAISEVSCLNSLASLLTYRSTVSEHVPYFALTFLHTNSKSADAIWSVQLARRFYKSTTSNRCSKCRLFQPNSTVGLRQPLISSTHNSVSQKLPVWDCGYYIHFQNCVDDDEQYGYVAIRCPV